MKTIFFGFLVLAVTSLLGGCLFVRSDGTDIPPAKVAEIVSGTTSKYDLIEAFGAPLVIARQNEELEIESALPDIIFADPASSALPLSSVKVNSNVYFELFRDKQALFPYHRVYYFRHHQSTGYLLYALIWFHDGGGTTSENLWALVDERNGRVEDYFFLEKGSLAF